MPYSRILISTEQLQQTVSKLAREIHTAYQGKDNCLALVMLDGAKYFAEDLLIKLNLPFEVEYVKASSYAGTNSTGTVKIDKNDSLKEKIRGKNILLIDDIYDTSKEDTLLSMVGELYSQRMLPSLLVHGVYSLPFIIAAVYCGFMFFQTQLVQYQLMYAAI